MEIQRSMESVIFNYFDIGGIVITYGEMMGKCDQMENKEDGLNFGTQHQFWNFGTQHQI